MSHICDISPLRVKMSLSSPVLIGTSKSDTDPIEDSSDIKEDAILIESSESYNTLSDKEINDDDHFNVRRCMS